MVYLLGISTFISFQKNEQLKFDNVQYVTKNITISNFNEKNKNYGDTNKLLNDKILLQDTEDKNDEKFLNIKGQNYDTLYRIYIDSTGDKSLPPTEKSNDYLIGKGKKDDWYNHLIVGISLDVSNKNEFLSKYKFFTATYLSSFNFWNSFKGWTNVSKKIPPLKAGVKTFNLTADNQEVTIFNETDASHSSNEKARLVMKQTWNGNVLNINWNLGVWYHWAWGSIFNHASFAQFTKDSYIFSKVPKSNDSNIKIKSQTLFENSKISLVDSSEVKGLKEIDKKIIEKSKDQEVKDSLFKFIPLFIQSYTGVKVVQNRNIVTIYSLAINVIYFPDSLTSLDSLLLLNNFSVKRTITSNLKGTNYKFIYENDKGETESTTSIDISSIFVGLQLNGMLAMPFIYQVKN